jgi:hypothetical protein
MGYITSDVLVSLSWLSFTVTNTEMLILLTLVPVLAAVAFGTQKVSLTISYNYGIVN